MVSSALAADGSFLIWLQRDRHVGWLPFRHYHLRSLREKWRRRKSSI
jgi:hypothetical protein